jgi:hypothetical protein
MWGLKLGYDRIIVIHMHLCIVINHHAVVSALNAAAVADTIKLITAHYVALQQLVFKRREEITLRIHNHSHDLGLLRNHVMFMLYTKYTRAA